MENVTITIHEVRETLRKYFVKSYGIETCENEDDYVGKWYKEIDDTIFMKQGRGGKVIHLSEGKCRQNNLFCGATYSRGGNRRASFLFPWNVEAVEVERMCKNCLDKLSR